MKIQVIEDSTCDDVEIVIKCRENNQNIQNMIQTLELLDFNIVGLKNGRSFMINPMDVFYFESVDEKIFCYKKDEVYETKYRLYELETLLNGNQFIRISRTMILNLNKIKSFKSALSGRIECTLKNNEKVFISRRYVKELKVKLGVKRGDHNA